MTSDEILARLSEKRREYCHEGMTTPGYFDGIIRAVFEVTAEVLANERPTT